MDGNSKEWSRGEKLWLSFALFVIILASVYAKSTIFDITASICGVIYVMMIVKQEKMAYIFGIINVLILGINLYNKAIYGGAIYNIIYTIPMLIYGYIFWGRAEKQKNKGVKVISTKKRILGSVITLIVIGVLAYILKMFGGGLYILDSTVSVLGYVGIYLMTNKYKEQWIMWIIINTINLIMWITLTTQSMANLSICIMWLIYTINSIFGYISWKKLEIK